MNSASGARNRVDRVPPRSEPAPPIERVAWTLVKPGRRVDLVLREHPLGTDLVCVYRGELLRSHVVKFGPDHDNAVQRAVEDARAAWEAKGWREPDVASA